MKSEKFEEKLNFNYLVNIRAFAKRYVWISVYRIRCAMKHCPVPVILNDSAQEYPIFSNLQGRSICLPCISVFSFESQIYQYYYHGILCGISISCYHVHCALCSKHARIFPNNQSLRKSDEISGQLIFCLSFSIKNSENALRSTWRKNRSVYKTFFKH